MEVFQRRIICKFHEFDKDLFRYNAAKVLCHFSKNSAVPRRKDGNGIFPVPFLFCCDSPKNYSRSPFQKAVCVFSEHVTYCNRRNAGYWQLVILQTYPKVFHQFCPFSLTNYFNVFRHGNLSSSFHLYCYGNNAMELI